MAASSSSSAAAPRASTSSSSSSVSAASANDAILRNALRYTISAREYATLHKYVLSRSRTLRRRAPSVEAVTRIMNGQTTKPVKKSSSASSSSKGGDGGGGGSKKDSLPPAEHLTAGADDFNARAVRHALRVFLATGAGMGLYEVLQRRLFKRAPRSSARAGGGGSNKKKPLYKSSTLRLSLSLSTILLMYRLLFRFFTRLRVHLLDPAAVPFRLRNPRTAAALTSPYAPAAGASLAGLALGIAPARFRMTIALMALCRALEFVWNAAEDSGAIWGVDMVPVSVRSAVGAAASAATSAATSGIRSAATVVAENGVLMRARPRPRPWWWGSWLLQPLAFGQLLHAAVFDRDCFPIPYGNFIFNRTLSTDTYLHPVPTDAPAAIASKWPGPYQIMDALSAMAQASWPVFSAPALFPAKDASQLLQLPVSASVAAAAKVSPAAASAAASAAVAAVAPLTSRAHPLIKSFSCATLHPDDPSCARTWLTFWLRSFPAYARFFLVVFTFLQLPRLSAVYHGPVQALQRLFARSLRSAAFLSGTLSTAWASVCFFQTYLPRHVLATQRFFLSGFLAGFWAWIERRQGRALFLYSARASLDSMWRVGVKRRWWRSPSQGGDVLVFVASLLLAGMTYEKEARAIREPGWRKGISWVRGEGWQDWAIEDEEDVLLADEEEEELGESVVEVPSVKV